MLCQACLRIGIAQLVFLDVKSYAAVHETVEALRMHPDIHMPYVDTTLFCFKVLHVMLCAFRFCPTHY